MVVLIVFTVSLVLSLSNQTAVNADAFAERHIHVGWVPDHL